MRLTLSLSMALTLILSLWSSQVAAQGVDVVGGTNSSATGTALAKGNSYDVLVPVDLTNAEFWLDFNDTQNLTFYVYESPVEFGPYTQIYTSSATVMGTGANWYGTGPILVSMSAGMHYLIAVSWSGTAGYNFNTGDMQTVSFGAHTHAYAIGNDPLPASIANTSNDQAIYYQRLSTAGQGPPNWQVNQAEAGFDVNGVQLLSAWAPSAARSTVAAATPSTANVTSTLIGTGHDILLSVQPLVAFGSGGFTIPGPEIVNVDLTDPFAFFLYGPGGLAAGLVPFTGNYSLPATSATPIFVVGQAAFLNPASPGGASLSQGAEYEALSCGNSANFDALASGANLPIGWSDGGGSAMWTVNSGTTPSAGTGPLTGAYSGTNYLYAETSGANTTGTFFVDTCNYDVSSLTTFNVDFRLSRIGATIGTLNVRQDDGSGTFPIILATYTGPEPTGLDWTAESVPLTGPLGATVQLRFEYTAAGSFTGDLGLDDVILP